MGHIHKRGMNEMVALAFGSEGEMAEPVTAANPLPTTIAPSQDPANSTPLTGASSQTAILGPFIPQLGRPINLSLSGDWGGTVQLLRSTNDGVNKLPLTVGGMPWGLFYGNANEPVWQETEAGSSFYLSFTRTSGTLNYRIAQ